MVSGLTPDHWNSKVHSFLSFCPLTKSFNSSFAKIVWCPSFALITKFHIKVCIVRLSSKVIHLHSLLCNCELPTYVTKIVRTVFTFSTLSRHILSIIYVTKPKVKASNESLIFKLLTQEAVISFWIKLFEFALVYGHQKISNTCYKSCYLNDTWMS